MGVQVFRDITIDFSNGRYIIINAKQHDSKSRFVRMTCTNVGQKINLNPNDYSAFIRYRKSDGYGVFNKCIISTEGQVIFELTEQMLSTVGTSYADLVVIDIAKSDINNDLTIISADGRIIENNSSLVSTMTFYINVLEKPLNDWDIESTNEFSALNDLLLKATKDYEYIVQTTEEYMNNAKNSENAAAQSANDAKTSADNAKVSEKNTAISERKAYEEAIAAFNSALLSKSYAIGESGFLTNELWEKILTDSEDYIPIESRPNEGVENAKYYYKQSKNQAENAKKSADNASTSEINAKKSEENAKQSETNAKDSETKSKASEDAAKAFADSIKESALLARSYAIGDTDTREGEKTDSAKYYYEQSKQISEGLNGALLPMGTIPFSQLVNQIKATGFMYNISDDFVSNDTFKDGGDITYPAGTNVYYTADGFWDCLTASLLYGVKGNAETAFRKGFVNLTPEDIGTYSKTEIDAIIQTLQETIAALTVRVATLEEIIESGDITITTKITDNDGNAIVTDAGEILIMSQEKY